MDESYGRVRPSRQSVNSEKSPNVETYATLINRKILIPSNATSYFAIEQHFFFALMEHALGDVEFDEDWYLTMHEDVREAIRKGLVKSGRNHYVRFGFYEHRLPFAIEVDEKWYLDAYPDVRDALDSQTYRSAQSHFEIAGFREGRLPYPNFSLAARKSAVGYGS